MRYGRALCAGAFSSRAGSVPPDPEARLNRRILGVYSGGYRGLLLWDRGIVLWDTEEGAQIHYQSRMATPRDTMFDYGSMLTHYGSIIKPLGPDRPK